MTGRGVFSAAGVVRGLEGWLVGIELDPDLSVTGVSGGAGIFQ
jgi:hypothetical protein